MLIDLIACNSCHSDVQVPAGVKLDFGTDEFVAAEERGIAVVKDCAFVLVAGGLGERLVYTDIKISLPVETATERCYLEVYVQHLLGMQVRNRSSKATIGCTQAQHASFVADIFKSHERNRHQNPACHNDI
jgi:hypothetical protein